MQRFAVAFETLALACVPHHVSVQSENSWCNVQGTGGAACSSGRRVEKDEGAGGEVWHDEVFKG